MGRITRDVPHGPVTGGRVAAFLLPALLLLSTAATARAAQDWPILHHDIRASVDTAGAVLEVVDRMRLAAPREGDAPLHLLLNRSLAVREATLHGAALEVKERAGFKPRHFWKRPDYEHLDGYAVARELTILPPPGGWPEAPSVTLRYAGAVYDSLRPPEVAYDRGFETTSGLIDPRGAFLSGATFWLPWSGEALFRYELRASVPAGWESISQGSWTERTVGPDGRVTSHWVVEHPMEEAYLIAGPYRVRKAPHGAVTAYTFTYADTPEDLCRTYLDATGVYLDRYDEEIGPYPFDKFALVENWWQTGFGMPSFTFFGDRVIRLPFIVHTSYGHEILHNWWGNGVFVDYDRGNWCEGLTTYLADYSYKEAEGAAAARDYRLGQLQAYLDYASGGGRDFPLREFTERESAATQAVGYGKTMMVFHMARRRLGDAAFFGGLKMLYRDFLFREASWDDLVRSFETAADTSLAAWFDQWIGRPGAPVLSIARVEDVGGRPVVEIRQEAPYYDLRVPLRVERSGEFERRRVALTGGAVRVTLNPEAEAVSVDPDFQLFRKLHRGEIPPALSQILGADSTVVVVGSRCDAAMAAALKDLAKTWGAHRDQRVVAEADFEGAEGRGVWLLGEGDLADRLVETTRAFGKAPRELRDRARKAGRSYVASFRDPDHEEIPWTVVLPGSPEGVAALGRKLPHYGHYSYLIFDGTSNTAKGSWVVERSPLRLPLEEAQ